jgi:outer membrane protein TolC
MCISARNRSRRTLALRVHGGVASLCMLSACAVGPDFVRPAAPAVAHYSAGGDPIATVSAEGTAQRFTPGAKVAAEWWGLFNSLKIDAVIVEAVANNPGLETA